jgi:hypothetical protein
MKILSLPDLNVPSGEKISFGVPTPSFERHGPEGSPSRVQFSWMQTAPFVFGHETPEYPGWGPLLKGSIGLMLSGSP